MKNKEYYKCPKCGSLKFNLQFDTFEEYGEDYAGEYIKIICEECKGAYFCFAVEQRLFKHIEKAYLEEELGIKNKNEPFTDID